jgi:alkyl sulfatase BDS1-like metallo-beta-lactamase superfamily hydrolase
MRPPTSHTALHNAAASVGLDRLDPDDFERARRGLLAQIPDGKIDGTWDLSRYAFLDSDEPDPAVHPSLWRQSRLNAVHGLFEVAPGCWQARGYDISNITFIEGRTGWVIVDPLTTSTTAAACLRLANDTLGSRPVTAVIYTHSHLDHYGGVLGVVDQQTVDAGDCEVIAPDGFMREVVAENVIAGPAMARRATYQFGTALPPGPRSHVDCGLGKAIALGPTGLIAPTYTVRETGEERTVDGVRIVFQNTPHSEAPAEMHFYFPDRRWLCLAENCTHTMHNLIPIRGAQARDTLAWSKYINEALDLFGDRTDVAFASHHWPRFGADDVRSFLRLQRDLYRWIHDQTMRFASHGQTPSEIAARLDLPQTFLDQGHTRGYYGHLRHNIAAVYQRYLSWYDGNPARLNPHPPQEAGRRYVEFMGGVDEVVRKAQIAFDEGDYRWVVEVVNHAVFAEPDHAGARSLQADALEQLGYQSESATFRNAYLTGARELREPRTPLGARTAIGAALTIELAFDAIGVRLRAEEVVGLSATVNWEFTDLDERWVLGLDHQAIHASPGRHDPAADATITTTRATFLKMLMGELNALDAMADGRLAVEGDLAALGHIFGHIDTFAFDFNIVEPQRSAS